MRALAIVVALSSFACRGDDRGRIRPVDETRASKPACETTCDGRCVDRLRDRGNCGACGHACGERACVLGECASPIGWRDTLAALDPTPGSPTMGRPRVALVCPPKGVPSSIWGTDVYTADSSLCGAAAHSGVISLADGGEFAIERRPGASAYEGSARFGVTSASWGAFVDSFVVIGERCVPGATRCGKACIDVSGDAHHCGACANECPARHSCLAGACVEGEVATSTTSLSAKACTPGAELGFLCPPTATSGARVWGTDVYTSDSSICVAAVHAGRITASAGGRVTVSMRAARASFRGSTRNGVTTASWGSWPCGYEFVGPTR